MPAASATVDQSAHTVSASRVFTDNGGFTVTVTVTDTEGFSSASDSVALTVTNATPVVEAGPDRSVAAGQALAFSVTFIDSGSADTHTATVDWGDGTGPQAAPVSAGGISLARIYAALATYMVTITVTDDGASASDTLHVTVTPAAVPVPGVTPWALALAAAALALLLAPRGRRHSERRTGQPGG